MDLQSLSNFIPEGNLLYLILIVSILAVLLYIVHSYTISDGENDDDEIMGKIIEEFKEPGVVGVVYEFNGLTLTKENHQPSVPWHMLWIETFGVSQDGLEPPEGNDKETGKN